MAKIVMEDVLKHTLNNKLKSEITHIAMSKTELSQSNLNILNSQLASTFDNNLVGDKVIFPLKYKSGNFFEINNDFTNKPMLVFNIQKGTGNNPVELWLLKHDTGDNYFVDGTVSTPLANKGFDNVVHLRTLKIEIVGAS